MMSFDELRQAEGELKGRIEHLHEFLHIDERREEMAELEKKMAAPDFWNDKESAQNTVSQLSGCRNLVEPFRRLESGFRALRIREFQQQVVQYSFSHKVVSRCGE